MPRFVILRHDTPPDYQRPLHWDFMLESGLGLQTWALPSEPAVGATVVAEILSDHRLKFLDYEGPLSGNRGNVSRWDQGTFEQLPADGDARVFRLSGDTFRGRVSIHTLPEHPGKAELRFDAEPE